MNQEILNFLSKHNVCSFTVLRRDGAPHAAALHFSNANEPFEVYFSTENTSMKCEALLDGSKVKASMVVGFSEEEWITLQMDGEVSAILDKDELAKAQSIHYAKHPNAAKYKDDPATIFLRFTPKWWRYSDFNTKPVTILSSNN